MKMIFIYIHPKDYNLILIRLIVEWPQRKFRDFILGSFHFVILTLKFFRLFCIDAEYRISISVFM